MGNSVAREERAISPLSAWGDRFEEYANGRYEDIGTPPPQRAAAKPGTKLDRSRVTTRRRDSLELARLDAERSTNSAHSLPLETTKKTKTKKKTAVGAPSKEPSSYPPTTYSLAPYPHDPPVDTPVHPNEFGVDTPVPGLLPRRKKTVATTTPTAFEGRKPWSAPTLPPPEEPSEVLLEAVPAVVPVTKKHHVRAPPEPVPAPLAVPVVQPIRTDVVRVGKPLHPPVNPARFLTLEPGVPRRSSSVPRSTPSEQLMKAPPKRTQSDTGDTSGISSTSSANSSTRVVGTKKKRGKAPPKHFKFYACPDNLLRPQTNYNGQPETLVLPERKTKSE